MKTIRWGIIGCGDVTEVKSGPGFQKADNSRLVAVMRRNGELAEDYARRHKVPKWFDDAKKLIADPEVDIVYIATPPAFHMEYTLLCAEAGKPVYVEKPMAKTYEECQVMMEACRKARVPLFVAYYRRALPRFLKVKEIIETGMIGEVRFAEISLYRQATVAGNKENLPWRLNPSISGGGLFFDLASHTLDVLDYILGPVAQAQGKVSNQAHLYDAEDIVTSNLLFESGVHATGLWCFSAYSRQDVVEIVGSCGKVTFSTFETLPVVLTLENQILEFPFENPAHIQQPLIQSIVNELNGRGTCPSNGLSASRTNWVMDEIFKEYR